MAKNKPAENPETEVPETEVVKTGNESNDDLLLIIAGKDEEIAALNEQISTLNSIIGKAENSNKKVNVAKAETAAIVVGDFDKEDKSWNCNKQKFRLPGDPVEYSAAEAIADNTLWNKLMAINGQKVFTEVV